MCKAVIWTTTVIGAAIGAFSAMMEGIGLMVVMGLIGATFGCAFGGGISLLIRVAKKRVDSPDTGDQGPTTEDMMGNASLGQMKMTDKWTDDQDRFPVAGDPDPVARAMTGSPDLANLNKNQGF